MLQNRRTDLALEAQELWQESAGEQTQLKGVQARDSQREGYAVTTVRILDQEGAQALGRAGGSGLGGLSGQPGRHPRRGRPQGP